MEEVSISWFYLIESGIIPTPDIYSYSVGNCPSALVIVSDGVLEVFSDQNIADIVWKLRDKPAEIVAKNIVNEAYSRWNPKNNYVDDCTCVVVYFDFPQ